MTYFNSVATPSLSDVSRQGLESLIWERKHLPFMGVASCGALDDVRRSIPNQPTEADVKSALARIAQIVERTRANEERAASERRW